MIASLLIHRIGTSTPAVSQSQEWKSRGKEEQKVEEEKAPSMAISGEKWSKPRSQGVLVRWVPIMKRSGELPIAMCHDAGGSKKSRYSLRL